MWKILSYRQTYGRRFKKRLEINDPRFKKKTFNKNTSIRVSESFFKSHKLSHTLEKFPHLDRLALI